MLENRHSSLSVCVSQVLLEFTCIEDIAMFLRAQDLTKGNSRVIFLCPYCNRQFSQSLLYIFVHSFLKTNPNSDKHEILIHLGKHFITHCCLALIFACIYYASLILEPGKYEAQGKFHIPSGKVN